MNEIKDYALKHLVIIGGIAIGVAGIQVSINLIFCYVNLLLVLNPP